jgi:hypothetical protein
VPLRAGETTLTAESHGRASWTPEEAIARAAALKRAGPRVLQPYLEHPDERVVLALLDNPNQPWGEHGRWVGSAVYVRAHRAAEVRGEVWNPLFEALDRARLWPYRDAVLQYLSERYAAPRADIPVRSASERLEPLAHYLSRQSREEDALGYIADFPGSALTRKVLECAPPLERLVAHAMERGADLDALLGNPATTEPLAGRLVEWALERIEGEPLDAEISPTLASDLAVLRRTAGSEALRPALSAAHLDRLLARVEEIGDAVPRKESVWYGLMRTAAQLSGRFDREQLERAYDAIKGHGHPFVGDLLKSPALGVELLRRIHGEMKRYRTLVHRIGHLPMAQMDPEIGPELGRQGGELGSYLLREGRGPAFRAALQKHVGKDTRDAATLVRSRIDEVADALRPGDLARAARSRVPAIRQEALSIEHILTCLHGSEPDLQSSLRALLPTDAGAVLAALRLLPAERLAAISQETWVQALRCESAEVRLFAIRNLGELASRVPTAPVSTTEPVPQAAEPARARTR